MKSHRSPLLSVTLLLIVGTLTAFVSGCAGWRNEVAARGSYVGSVEGDYVIRNDSGGRIMDVWVLRKVFVQAHSGGAGWYFQDARGNVVHLGGDVKVIRVNTPAMLEQYHEYHAEFESRTYQELYPATKGVSFR